MSWRKIVLGLGAGFRRKARKRGLSLCAIARAELGEDDRASVGKSYTIKAGMAQNRPAHFIGAPFTLSRQSHTDPIWFDLVLHTSGNIAADDTWHQRLHYDPRQTGPQLVSFPFHFMAPGRGILAINFYHEQRWLKTIRFEVETLERSAVDVAITTG